MKWTVKQQGRGVLKRRQVRVALVSDNGQELLGSEGYNNLGDALAMIDLVGAAFRSPDTQVPTELAKELQ